MLRRKFQLIYEKPTDAGLINRQLIGKRITTISGSHLEDRSLGPEVLHDQG